MDHIPPHLMARTWNLSHSTNGEGGTAWLVEVPAGPSTTATLAVFHYDSFSREDKLRALASAKAWVWFTARQRLDSSRW